MLRLHNATKSDCCGASCSQHQIRASLASSALRLRRADALHGQGRVRTWAAIHLGSRRLGIFVTTDLLARLFWSTSASAGCVLRRGALRLWRSAFRSNHSTDGDDALPAPNSSDCAMLQNLTEDVRSCYEQAEWCASQAKTAVNKQTREDFLQLAQRWLKLARSYQIARSTRSETLTAEKRK